MDFDMDFDTVWLFDSNDVCPVKNVCHLICKCSYLEHVKDENW